MISFDDNLCYLSYLPVFFDNYATYCMILLLCILYIIRILCTVHDTNSHNFKQSCSCVTEQITPNF